MSDRIDRVIERLRRDHPDPEMRKQLYADHRLAAYVRVLLADASDEEIAQVEAAEDNSAGPMTSAGEKRTGNE